MHSGGFELTKLTYTGLEDNLIRHPPTGFWHMRPCLRLERDEDRSGKCGLLLGTLKSDAQTSDMIP